MVMAADGISIPSSYTAYISPICSPKLHNEVLLNTNKSSPETPYVVMFQSVKTLSGEGGGLRGVCGTKIQECWTFIHPRRDAVLNDQGKLLSFHSVDSDINCIKVFR
jgi:type II protein arginine methyltransferase